MPKVKMEGPRKGIEVAKDDDWLVGRVAQSFDGSIGPT